MESYITSDDKSHITSDDKSNVSNKNTKTCEHEMYHYLIRLWDNLTYINKWQRVIYENVNYYSGITWNHRKFNCIIIHATSTSPNDMFIKLITKRLQNICDKPIEVKITRHCGEAKCCVKMCKHDNCMKQCIKNTIFNRNVNTLTELRNKFVKINPSKAEVIKHILFAMKSKEVSKVVKDAHWPKTEKTCRCRHYQHLVNCSCKKCMHICKLRFDAIDRNIDEGSNIFYNSSFLLAYSLQIPNVFL